MKLKITLTSLCLMIGTILMVKAQDSEFKLDEDYSIDSDGTIELYSDDANITITGSDRKDVHVYIFRRQVTRGIRVGQDDFRVDVFEQGGNLIIKERSRSGYTMMGIGVFSEDYEISIEAPNGVSLELSGDDDDYLIKNMNGSISMRIDDGDAELFNCNGNHFEFDMDDGDLELRGGNGFLYVKADDGDVVIRDGNFSEVNASLDDGDIVLETVLADNGDYSFRVDDGSIDFKVLGGGGEFEIRHDDARIISSDAFSLISKEEDETILRLSNGNARVRVRANDARVRLSSL